MFADIAMAHHHQFGGLRRPAFLVRLRVRLARIAAAAIVGGGFVAALAWAFFGSLALGIGTQPVDEAVAWAWLAVALAIGVAVLAALLLGAPPGGGTAD
jgi:hypothetical protein